MRNDQPGWLARLRDSYMAYHYHLPSQAQPGPQAAEDNIPTSSTSKLEDEVKRKSRRGRPRKHAPKIPLPPLYVFIRYPISPVTQATSLPLLPLRNLLHNHAYNPSVITWVDENVGCFKISNTVEFARTWGKMKANRYIVTTLTVILNNSCHS